MHLSDTQVHLKGVPFSALTLMAGWQEGHLAL